jgi:chromate transport protein ChrA
VLAIICGILTAGGVHAVKATARPVITATTGGMLNPAVSTAEDVTALAVSVLAIVVPLLTFVLLVVAIACLLRWVFRRRSKPAT